MKIYIDELDLDLDKDIYKDVSHIECSLQISIKACSIDNKSYGKVSTNVTSSMFEKTLKEFFKEKCMDEEIKNLITSAQIKIKEN